MPDVSDTARPPTTNDLLRDAAIDAGYELELFDVLALGSVPDGGWTLDALADGLGIGSGRRRLRALLDALVGYGVLAREGNAYRCALLVKRPSPPTYKAQPWGAIVEVIRRDEALPPRGQDGIVRMHLHVAKAGTLGADELAPLLGEHAAPNGRWLVDLGGGAGAHTAAFLARYPDARATLVDVPELMPLAREQLAPYGSRAELVTADITDGTIRGASAALLANTLHLHGAQTCAQLCKLAASTVASGGVVAIKDLRLDADRLGPPQSLAFALDLAVFTQDGDVHETSLLREWLVGAGLVDIAERRLATSPDAVVVFGKKP